MKKNKKNILLVLLLLLVAFVFMLFKNVLGLKDKIFGFLENVPITPVDDTITTSGTLTTSIVDETIPVSNPFTNNTSIVATNWTNPNTTTDPCRCDELIPLSNHSARQPCNC